MRVNVKERQSRKKTNNDSLICASMNAEDRSVRPKPYDARLVPTSQPRITEHGDLPVEVDLPARLSIVHGVPCLTGTSPVLCLQTHLSIKSSYIGIVRLYLALL